MEPTSGDAQVVSTAFTTLYVVSSLVRVWRGNGIVTRFKLDEIEVERYSGVVSSVHNVVHSDSNDGELQVR